jgi:uncharacterized protein (TIGR00369 family)
MHETPAEFINAMPATDAFGMEITEAADGHARGRLPFQEAFCFDGGDEPVLHGAVTFALADNAGAAAVMSHFEAPEPAFTIDLRIDYLDAATTDIRAEAEVRRFGSVVGVADVVVEDANGEAVALARGSYRSA